VLWTDAQPGLGRAERDLPEGKILERISEICQHETAQYKINIQCDGVGHGTQSRCDGQRN